SPSTPTPAPATRSPSAWASATPTSATSRPSRRPTTHGPPARSPARTPARTYGSSTTSRPRETGAAGSIPTSPATTTSPPATPPRLAAAPSSAPPRGAAAGPSGPDADTPPGAGRIGAAVWLYDEPAEPSERQRHLAGLYCGYATEHLARLIELTGARDTVATLR